MFSQYTLLCEALNLELERTMIDMKNKPYCLLEAFVNAYRNIKNLIDKIMSNQDFLKACGGLLAEAEPGYKPGMLALTAMEQIWISKVYECQRERLALAFEKVLSNTA
jgi:hypothetical protein